MAVHKQTLEQEIRKLQDATDIKNKLLLFINFWRGVCVGGLGQG